MALFDDLTKKAEGFLSGAGDDKSKLLVAALQVIMTKFGGLDGLVQAFERKGLGSIAASWVGKGENKSITPQQLQQGIGADTVQQIAGKVGQPESTVLSQLSGELPKLIDKLTPDGRSPAGNLLEQGMNLLQRK